MSARGTMKIPPDVLPILARSAIVGNELSLPEQLDRKTYVRVDKVLKAAGGTWSRKARAHVFAFDPRELLAGAVQDGVVVDRTKALQFFETPDPLARRMVELARLADGERVLEPSAGRGRIVRRLIATEARIDAVEIDADNCNALRQLSLTGFVRVHHGAFEDYAATEGARFDAAVMNPPFAGNLDMTHIRLAWNLLKPSGRLIAICSEGPFFRQDAVAVAFRDWLDEIGADYERLPKDTFRESGTGVATRLIVVATRTAA